jgi:hypothetical protein
MSKLNVIIAISIVYMLVSLTAGYFMQANIWADMNKIATYVPNTDSVTAISFISVALSSVKFFIGMFAFAVEGIPQIFSVIWILMAIALLWCILEMIRGN